jgi:alpha,alpha-trehalose-phosphate synthase [UDP-forming]
MEPILYDTGGLWLGWNGYFAGEDEGSREELFDVTDIAPPEELSNNRGKNYKIGTIPLTEEEVSQYYNNFSNGTLWALFHYFFEKCELHYKSWQVYRQVNRKFAEHVARVAGQNDIVWVQDYQLFMVPYFLKRLRPDLMVHYFLHIPFPHTDIFSILPWQEQILRSLLCCDSIGFHHQQYLNNFESAVKAYRTDNPSDDIREKTLFFVNPISINFDLIDSTSRKHSVKRRKKEIIKKSGCSDLIVGVDRIDYSKGIKERLLGLENLLEKHPELTEKFFYYQLVIPSREQVGSYMRLKREIDEIIGRINGRFATGMWMPVHYNYGKLPFEELIALYLSANIALITPLRDGMNLVSKEYVAAHSDNKGVLILSKFAGAIAEIKNSIAVNPYSIEDIAEAIYRALNMSDTEKNERMKKMRSNIKKNNINSWLEKCISYFERSAREL